MVIADFVYDGRTISPIKYLPELLQPIQDFQGLNDAYKAELKELAFFQGLKSCPPGPSPKGVFGKAKLYPLRNV